MRDFIIQFLQESLGIKTPIEVSIPEDARFGDYSTNVAFRLAKEKNGAPLPLAQALVKKLEERNSSCFQKIAVAPPGFINFWISPDFFHAELQKILKEKQNYGKKKLSPKEKKRVQVEFVSANPTGPLTLANGRGGFLGDVIANVLLWSGHTVEREYYVNDTGNQIITFGKSLSAVLGLIPHEDTFYKGAYILEWATKNKTLVKKLYKKPLVLGMRASKDFLKEIKKALEKKAKIYFDRYTSETQIHKKKFPEKALMIFRKLGMVYEKEGALWLETTRFGDDKDRVLETSDKSPTYFLADAGHYLETKERKFGMKINILGPDHYGYVARIQAAAKMLGLENSHVLVTQAIRIVENGEEVKMSKRKGQFITFEELVEEVGADAARFHFLALAPETHLDFDLEKAKARSVKNPVYYAQYAFVRAQGVLNKVKNLRSGKARKIRSKLNSKSEYRNPKQFELLNTAEDMRLMAKLFQFPEVMADTAQDFHVHRITRYVLELARVFHNFYEKEHIIGEEADVVNARVALVTASLQIFENLFNVLGISAPKKM